MRLSSRSFLLLLAPLLMASKCGKKTTDEVIGAGTANDPSVRLQLISLEPGEVPPGKAFSTTIYGSGIEDGASVWLGGAAMNDVSYKGETSLLVRAPALTAGEYDVKVQNPDGEEATLRGGLWVNPDYRDPNASTACARLTVYFDYDSYALSPASKATLDANVACLNALGSSLRVEGHCDERGTTEYNLALGQRRADTIQRYLVAGGITPSRLRTISYGEERPATQGATEAAYSANRRGEIVAER
jgi:peptidoglycan-associated lipoprotein